MLRLLDVVIDSKYSYRDKITFLKSCCNTGTFKNDDVESIGLVSKKIKSLLNAASDRTEGMLLLQIFMDECSTEVFVENALSWANLTLKVIKGTDNVEDKRLACLVFRQLIPLLPSFPAVWKQVAGSVVNSLFEVILRVSPEDEWAEDAFELLVCCLKTFPGSFGPHKVSIENFILKHLAEWPQPVLKILASCVSLLPWCSGGGVQGVNHSSAWSTQLDNMLASLDKMLDLLYNEIDIYEDGAPLLLSSLELPPLSVFDPLLSVFRVHRHFQFLGLCVQVMLSDQHSTVVKIPFDDLLSFIWKALSVNSIEALEKPSLEAAAVASVVPAVHCMALSLLETLICGFRRQLAVHAHSINNILLQSLIWTSKDDCPYGTEKSYSGVRVQTYQAIQAWIDCLGPLSGIHEQGEAFVNHFLSDLRMEQDCIQLLSPSDVDRPRGRKRKRKQGEMFANTLNSQKKANILANRELCLNALKALKSVLYSSGSLLEIDLHKKIHAVILQILMEVQQQSQSADSTNFPVPYSSSKCRRELYAVLLACVLCPHSQWPPPLQPSVMVFKRGQLDHNLHVSSFCCEGLAVLNVAMHPRVTVLQYVEQQIESQSLHQHRNRASNVMDESSAHHTQQRHSRLIQDDKDEMDFTSSYSQENLLAQAVSNGSLKRKQKWNGEEQSIIPEAQQAPTSETVTDKVPPSTLVPPLPQPLPPTPTALTTAAAPTQLQPQPPTTDSLASSKPSTPPVVIPQPPQQQVKPILPPTPQPVLQQSLQSQNKQTKAGPLHRASPGGVARASEEVVLLSEEESAEDNHIEEGAEDEEEEDEDEEEGEEEEEEEGYYPEEEDEEAEYEGYRRDKSPSLVLTCGRSTEDSSSTGHAVSSIVGNLVTVTVTSNSIPPAPVRVQKARRTGILARTETPLKEVEKKKMEEMECQELEDEEEQDYECEDTYDDEEEEGIEGECEEEQDDIEEIHELDEHEEEEEGDDQIHYQMDQKWREMSEEDMHEPSVLIPDDNETEEPLSEKPDSTEPESDNMTMLQPLQILPGSVEHSTEILPTESHEPQIIGATSVTESEFIGTEEEKAELDAGDSEFVLQNQEPSGNDSDVIEISDSPVKEIQANAATENEVENLASDMDNIESSDQIVIVQQFTETDDVSEVMQVTEISDSVQDDKYKDESMEEITGDARVVDEPVTVSSGKPSSEGQSVTNDEEVMHSPTKEHSNGEAEDSTKDLNHSVVESRNCASEDHDEKTEENKTVSSDTADFRAHIRARPDSPEEPAAKKLRILMREKEEEPEPDEESPPLNDMLNNFVCCVRETD